MTERLALRVLVADDEKPARAKVRRFLDADPDVAVVHEAWDGGTALSVIRDEEPDLVLLDIEMPGGSGLDVLASLPPDAAPHVVFITAFDEHAVRAFELAAVDYLLKPFDAARFARALARAKQAIASDRRGSELTRLASLLRDVQPAAERDAARLDRLLVDDGPRKVLVQLDEVDRLEADRNYVRVYAGGHSRRVRGTLADLESRLDPNRFARVGRGTIVNLERVTVIEPVGHGDYLLLLRDGSRVRLSRRFTAAVEARLGL